MPTFKVTLFDNDEIKSLEDTLFRALVRAMRVVAKEGLVAGYKPPEPETVPEETDAPIFGKHMNGGNAAPVPPVEEEEPEPRKRRSVADACRRVSEKLPGYVGEEEAKAIIGVERGYAAQILRKWVLDGKLEGVIYVRSGSDVADGELMVHKQRLVTLNETRKRNANLPPRQRQSMPMQAH